jgi:hypothetical protein
MADDFVADHYGNLSLPDLKKAAGLLFRMRVTAGNLYARQIGIGSDEDQTFWHEYREAEAQLHSILPPVPD